MLKNWRTTPKNMRWAYLFTTLDKQGNRVAILVLLCILMACLFAFHQLNEQWRTTVPSPIDEAHPVQMLDLYSAYTAEEAWLILEALGPDKRQLYLLIVLSLDIVFPITYTLLFIWLFIYLLRKSYPRLFNVFYRFTILFPLLLLIADFLENVSIVINLSIFPQRSDTLLNMADFFTESKWILLNFMLLWIFIGIIAMWMNQKEVLDYQAKQAEIKQKIKK